MGRPDRCLFILIAGLIFLTGCGSETKVGQFETYVTQFEQAAKSSGRPLFVRNVVIEFGEPQGRTTIAECITESLHTPRIQISPTRWKMMSETSRQLTVFHELGHCYLKRTHRRDLREDGSPASIMYPYNVTEDVFDEEKEYYLDELFNWKNDE